MGMPVVFESCSQVKPASFRRTPIKSPDVPVGVEKPLALGVLAVDIIVPAWLSFGR